MWLWLCKRKTLRNSSVCELVCRHSWAHGVFLILSSHRYTHGAHAPMHVSGGTKVLPGLLRWKKCLNLVFPQKQDAGLSYVHCHVANFMCSTFCIISSKTVFKHFAFLLFFFFFSCLTRPSSITAPVCDAKQVVSLLPVWQRLRHIQNTNMTCAGSW